MREIIKNTGSVYFSSSKWNVLNSKISDLKPSTIFILVDSNTLKHCLTFLLNKLTIKDNYKILEIQAGEMNKNIKTCEYLWNQLSENGADRKSLLINRSLSGRRSRKNLILLVKLLHKLISNF